MKSFDKHYHPLIREPPRRAPETTTGLLQIRQNGFTHILNTQNLNAINWEAVYRLPFDGTIETKLINFRIYLYKKNSHQHFPPFSSNLRPHSVKRVKGSNVVPWLEINRTCSAYCQVLAKLLLFLASCCNIFIYLYICLLIYLLIYTFLFLIMLQDPPASMGFNLHNNIL